MIKNDTMEETNISMSQIDTFAKSKPLRLRSLIKTSILICFCDLKIGNDANNFWKGILDANCYVSEYIQAIFNKYSMGKPCNCSCFRTKNIQFCWTNA